MKITLEGTIEQIIEACAQLCENHKLSLRDQNWEAWKTSLIQAYMESERFAAPDERAFYVEWFRAVA